MQRAVIRNSLSPSQALELCCAGDGEVDIVTEVDTSDAARVQESQHARLIVADANRVLCCIVNRARTDVPLDNVDIRKALNLAVDRDRIIADGLHGYANPVPAMTRPGARASRGGARPYPHDPNEARRLFEKGGWPSGRPIRIAAPGAFRGIAQLVAGISARRWTWPSRSRSCRPLAGARVLVEKKLDMP